MMKRLRDWARRPMTRRARGRRDRWIIATVFVALFLLLFSPWSGEGYDDFFYYSYLSSPAFDGDLSLTNDLALSNNTVPMLRDRLSAPNSRGHMSNFFAVGTAALWSPFFAAVKSAGWIAERLPGGDPGGPAWASDRFSAPYRWAVSLASAFYGLLALLLIYESCRMRFGERTALHAALGAGCGSLLLAYILNSPAMSHACSAFAVALMLWLSLRLRKFRGVGSYVALGAALGLVTIVRWQDVVLGLVPAGFWLVHVIRKGSRRRLRARQGSGWSVGSGLALFGPLAAVLAFAAVFSLQAAYWHAYLGQWLTIPQSGGFMRWGAPELHNLLFSGWNGAFYWHPILAIGAAGLLAGLVMVRRRLWPTHLVIVLGVAVAVYVNACAGDWWAGSSFGMRRFASLVPLFALGLAAVYARLPRRARRWLPLWTALVVGVNVVLLVGFTRQFLRPYFVTEVALLGSDFWREVPGFISTMAVQYETVGGLIAAGRGGAAVVLAACGLGVALMALAAWRTRGWWHAGHRRAWLAAGALGMAILVADAWTLDHALPEDPQGIAFARISPHLNPHSTLPSLETLETLGQAWPANPVPWLLVLDAATTDTQRRPALDALHRFSPKLWARAVLELPDTPLRRELAGAATPLAGRSGDMTFLRRMAEINEAHASGEPRRERRAVRAFLRAYPLSPYFLDRLAALWRQAGDEEQADALNDLAGRVLEARVESFSRHADELGEAAIHFYNIFVKHDAEELDRRLWREGKLAAADRLVEKLARAGVLEPWQSARQRLASVVRGSAGPDSLLAEVAAPDVNAEAVADVAAACLALGHPHLAERLALEGKKRWPGNPEIVHALAQVQAARMKD